MASGSKKRHEEGYGRGTATIELDDEVLLDEKALTERLLAVFRSPSYRAPTLPASATRLLELSRDPDVSFDAVVALLEQDALLAGRVLQVARSAVYSGAQRIEGLREALTRLGLRTLRDLVLEAAMNLRVFRSRSYAGPMERLRRHARTTAQLARLVSRHTPHPDEYAFLCGLLHDVGIAGILLALGDGVPPGRKAPDLTVIWPAVEAAHEEAGAAMVKLWELPGDLPLVLGAHHQVEIGGHPHPLAATVCLADDLANELGFGLAPSPDEAVNDAALEGLATHLGVDRSTPRQLERAREALSLGDATLALVRDEALPLLEPTAGD